MKEALEGLNALDLTRYVPGPYYAMGIGILGADVIEVEEVNSIFIFYF